MKTAELQKQTTEDTEVAQSLATVSSCHLCVPCGWLFGILRKRSQG
jgi:hypothetical protein